MAAGEDPDRCSVFGPWMAAVRQRSVVDPQPKVPSTASASCPAPHPASADPSVDVGWKTQVKLRRRRPSGPSMEAQATQVASASVAVPVQQALANVKGSDRGKQLLVKEGGEKADAEMVAVPVHQARAVFQASAREPFQLTKAGALDSHKSQSLILSNPIASLSSDSNEGGHLDHSNQFSGPLKRARPVDSLPPRSISKPEKRKEKGKDKNVKN